MSLLSSDVSQLMEEISSIRRMNQETEKVSQRMYNYATHINEEALKAKAIEYKIDSHVKWKL